MQPACSTVYDCHGYNPMSKRDQHQGLAAGQHYAPLGEACSRQRNKLGEAKGKGQRIKLPDTNIAFATLLHIPEMFQSLEYAMTIQITNSGQ